MKRFRMRLTNETQRAKIEKNKSIYEKSPRRGGDLNHEIFV